ncbi:MAG TPA: polyprenyl synthetase family protein, partial [Nocardioidaceae bacterium]
MTVVQALDPVPAELRDRVAAELDEFVDGKQTALAPIGTELDALIDAARKAVSGGKRLRPAFAYWGWRAAGGSADKTDAIIKA